MGDESKWSKLTDLMKKILKAGRISDDCDISRRLVSSVGTAPNRCAGGRGLELIEENLLPL